MYNLGRACELRCHRLMTMLECPGLIWKWFSIAQVKIDFYYYNIIKISKYIITTGYITLVTYLSELDVHTLLKDQL